MLDEKQIIIKERKFPVKVIDTLYTTLGNVIKDENISTLNIVLIATNLMQLVESYPNLNGSDKKELVIHVLKMAVEDSLEGDVKINVLLFIEIFLPSVIDTIISVDKKEINVKIRKGYKLFFSCC
jgi:hypothetical protein